MNLLMKVDERLWSIRPRKICQCIARRYITPSAKTFATRNSMLPTSTITKTALSLGEDFLSTVNNAYESTAKLSSTQIKKTALSAKKFE